MNLFRFCCTHYSNLFISFMMYSLMNYSIEVFIEYIHGYIISSFESVKEMIDNFDTSAFFNIVVHCVFEDNSN